jgi:hypothetical protein
MRPSSCSSLLQPKSQFTVYFAILALVIHSSLIHGQVGVSFEDGSRLITATNSVIPLSLTDSLTKRSCPKVQVWDPHRHTLLANVCFPGIEVQELALSPDERSVAICTRASIIIADTLSVRKVGEVALPGELLLSCAFLYDQRHLLITTRKAEPHYPIRQRLVLWDMDRCAIVSQLEVKQPPLCVSVSRNGFLAAVADTRGTITIKDLLSGSDFLDIKTGSDRPREIRFSSRCQYLAMLSMDGSVVVWHLATGQELWRVRGSTRLDTRFLAMSTDDEFLASVDSDGCTRLRRLHTGAVLDHCVRTRTTLAFFHAKKSLILVDDTGQVNLQELDPRQTASPAADRFSAGEGVRSNQGRLNEAALRQLWTELKAPDARRAFDAQLRIVSQGENTIPFLSAQIRHAVAETQAMERLIRDLDSDDFAVRETASAMLLLFDRAAYQPLLQERSSMSAEVRRRAEALIASLDSPFVTSPSLLQLLRAVSCIERIPGADAVSILQEIRKGPPKSRLTIACHSALTRKGIER